MSTKISQKTLEKLLKGLGADVELAETDDEGLDLSAVQEKIELHAVDGRKAGIEQELRQTVKSELAGEFGDVQRKTVAKLFGITDRSVLKDMNLDKMLEKAKEVYAQELNKNVSDWNSEKQELANRIAEMEEAHTTALKAKETEWQTKYSERDVLEGLRSHMEKVPRTGGDLQMQTKLWRNELKDRGLEPRYNADKKEIEYYKGNQLYVENGKTLKSEDLAKDFAKNSGFYAESTSHIAPAKLAIATERGDVKQMTGSPYEQLQKLVGQA